MNKPHVQCLKQSPIKTSHILFKTITPDIWYILFETKWTRHILFETITNKKYLKKHTQKWTSQILFEIITTSTETSSICVTHICYQEQFQFLQRFLHVLLMLGFGHGADFHGQFMHSSTCLLQQDIVRVIHRSVVQQALSMAGIKISHTWGTQAKKVRINLESFWK